MGGVVRAARVIGHLIGSSVQRLISPSTPLVDGEINASFWCQPRQSAMLATLSEQMLQLAKLTTLQERTSESSVTGAAS